MKLSKFKLYFLTKWWGGLVNSKEIIINFRLSEDCLICGTFLTGFGGFLSGLTDLKRILVNPNVYNQCNMHIENGKGDLPH